MSDSQSGALGGDGGAGSTSEDVTSDQDNSNQNDNDDTKDLVPKSVAERYKADLMKWKDRARENERKLSEVNERLSAIEAEKEDGNDFKAQAERYKREAEAYKSQLSETKESFVYSTKYNSVLKELRKLGLKDEAERYIEYEDLKDLEVETTSRGRVNVLGSEDWAADFMKRNPILFETKKTVRVSSTDGRSVSTSETNGEITPAMIVEAERKAKKSGNVDDISAYKKMFESYQKQKKQRRA